VYQLNKAEPYSPNLRKKENRLSITCKEIILQVYFPIQKVKKPVLTLVFEVVVTT